MIAQAIDQEIPRLADLENRRERHESAAANRAHVPENIVLDWKREQLSLDVTLKESRSTSSTASRRTRPVRRALAAGYARVDLAELARQRQSPTGSTAVRETIARPRAAKSRATETPRGDPQRRRGGRSLAVEPCSRCRRAPVLLPVFNLDEVVGAPTRRPLARPASVPASQPRGRLLPPPRWNAKLRTRRTKTVVADPASA